MPTRDDAIKTLELRGEHAAAGHVRRFRNVRNNAAGWDENLKAHFPHVVRLLWPEDAGATRNAKKPPGTSAAAVAATSAPSTKAHDIPSRAAGTTTLFDAYVMVDWSAASSPKAPGPDSIWWASLVWEGGRATVRSHHERTRAAAQAALSNHLTSVLSGARVLVGFDFPFGYPRGFAAALGLDAVDVGCWRATWSLIDAMVQDGPDNANNRFDVASQLNARASGSFGPFYGCAKPRPNLSSSAKGVFSYPLRSSLGPMLAARRETDLRGGTASSPWFLYGGSNTVGSQALLGIPRVSRLRASMVDSLVWPFETGRKLPAPSEARVVFAEIYPSLFIRRDATSTDVHDRLQVVAAAEAFARTDVCGDLSRLFTAPPDDDSVLQEEGWILGVN